MLTPDPSARPSCAHVTLAQASSILSRLVDSSQFVPNLRTSQHLALPDHSESIQERCLVPYSCLSVFSSLRVDEAGQMGLVDYSSSESEEEESQPLLKRPRLGSKSLQCKEIEPAELPPLPDSFRDLYAVKARATLEDDPSLHHGRKRTTPHAEGSWPTHVYLECTYLDVGYCSAIPGMDLGGTLFSPSH